LSQQLQRVTSVQKGLSKHLQNATLRLKKAIMIFEVGKAIIWKKGNKIVNNLLRLRTGLIWTGAEVSLFGIRCDAFI